MKKIFNPKFNTFFSEQANLLDSKLYIIKAFFAVATAYFIAINNSVLRLDIISVLFGLMLTLEPVTLTGIKNGLSQVYASILGSASTAIIIYFLGINTYTIALSISFTLFVCLRINWREVSPVAIFTSIYMTQYVQKTAEGIPSIFLTFKLRILALGCGVLVAIVYNYLFSIIYNRTMVYKRILFLLDTSITNLEDTKKYIIENDKVGILAVKNNLAQTFKNIEWILSLFEDMRKEHVTKFDNSFVNKTTKDDIGRIINIVLFIRNISHLNYDIIYILLKNDFIWDESILEKKKVIDEVNIIISNIKEIKEIFYIRNLREIKRQKLKCEKKACGTNLDRILFNLDEMILNINNIESEIDNIKFLNKE